MRVSPRSTILNPHFIQVYITARPVGALVFASNPASYAKVLEFDCCFEKILDSRRFTFSQGVTVLKAHSSIHNLDLFKETVIIDFSRASMPHFRTHLHLMPNVIKLYYYTCLS